MNIALVQFIRVHAIEVVYSLMLYMYNQIKYGECFISL